MVAGSWRKPKEFVCPFCSRDFRKQNQLRNHIKDLHPEYIEWFIQNLKSGSLKNGTKN